MRAIQTVVPNLKGGMFVFVNDNRIIIYYLSQQQLEGCKKYNFERTLVARDYDQDSNYSNSNGFVLAADKLVNLYNKLPERQ